MSSAQWVQNSHWGGVLFGLKVKSPCLRGVPHHVLGLQCHPMGCNFSMEWSVVWITVTQATCQTPRFGKLGHARRSMGPKRSLERVLFSLKSPCWRGVQRHVLCLECHRQVVGISGWNGWYGSMGSVRRVGHLASVNGSMPSPQWVPNSDWRWAFLAENLHVGGGFSGH